MTDTELADSLRAAQALRSGLRRQAGRPAFRPLDATGLTGGATRPPRRGPWLAAAVAVVLVVAAGALMLPGLGDGASVPATPGATTAVVPRDYGVWTRIAASPLSPRWEPHGVWVDGRYLVFGGHSDFLCPPNASCKAPDWLADGAYYDPPTDRWTSIADMPAGSGFGGAPAVVGSSVYVISWRAAAQPSLLRYDLSQDVWTSYRLPVDPSGELVATDSALLILSSTDEFGEVDDVVFDPATGEFGTLPADPLGPSYNRTAVWTGDRLLLAAQDLVDSPGAEEPSLVRLAELDAGLTTWRELGATEILGAGTTMRCVGGRVVWPRLGSADGGEIDNWGRSYDYGGIYDPDVGTWTGLPDPPSAGGLPGPAIVAGGGLVELGGHLLNPVTLEWTTVPALPVRDLAGATTAGGDESVLVWGGGDYDTPTADGYLLWVRPVRPTPSPEHPTASPTPAEPEVQPTPPPPDETPVHPGG